MSYSKIVERKMGIEKFSKFKLDVPIGPSQRVWSWVGQKYFHKNKKNSLHITKISIKVVRSQVHQLTFKHKK